MTGGAVRPQFGNQLANLVMNLRLTKFISV
jgi:hypothetical protein